MNRELPESGSTYKTHKDQGKKHKHQARLLNRRPSYPMKQGLNPCITTTNLISTLFQFISIFHLFYYYILMFTFNLFVAKINQNHNWAEAGLWSCCHLCHHTLPLRNVISREGSVQAVTQRLFYWRGCLDNVSVVTLSEPLMCLMSAQ